MEFYCFILNDDIYMRCFHFEITFSFYATIKYLNEILSEILDSIKCLQTDPKTLYLRTHIYPNTIAHFQRYIQIDFIMQWSLRMGLMFC